MPPASSSSFIPKRNPSAKLKRAPIRSIFVLSVISYSLFIAAPLASVGVFIFQLQSQKNSIEALEALNEAIDSFNIPDYSRLLEFNDRLNATQILVDSHVSVASVFDIISKATADTVKFETFDLVRTGEDTIVINANLKTSAFDGALFQRGQYDAQSLIDTTKFTEVTLTAVDSSGEIQSSNSVLTEKIITLKAEFNFTADDIKYTPLSAFVVPDATIETTTANASTSNETDI